MADPADIPRIRRNVEKMIGMGAPEAEIDQYLSSEGHTPDSFKAAVRPVGQGGAPSMPPDPPPERGLLQRTGDFMRDQVGWQATRALNAGTALLGSNPIVEPIRHVAAAVVPDSVNRFMKYAYPDAQTMRDVAHDVTGTQPVNLPGTAGKIVDSGVEMAIGGAAFPGGAVRNTVAGFGAGIGSEGAGTLTKGSRWEPAARFAGGLVGGTVGAGAVEAATAAGRGLRNTFGMNDTDKTAARVVSRGYERDKVAPSEIPNRMAALGDDAMPMDVGGPNVRGTLRGAIAAPGDARTTVDARFTARDAKEGPTVAGSIDKNISPKGLTQAVDDLVTERRNAAAPAYDRAGVPSDPGAYAQAPVLQGQAVTDLIKNSVDVRRAIATARRLPDYKDLPDTSMVMLDKAYKHIGGMADAAKRAGNGERFRDLDSLRVSLRDAIAAENPAYIDALGAFSGPSALIDAAKAGQRAFAGNVAPEAVRRDFAKLSPDAQDAFLVGVSEHLRTRADARGATGIAGRVINPRDAQRLQAILPPDRYDAFMADIATRKTFTANQRDVGQGSRTTPMALEAGDNAAQIGGDVAMSLAQGRPGNAVLQAITGFSKRVGQGQNERVNARIAEMLTNGSPEARRALIDALEQSLLDQRIASPANTFRAGAALPVIGGAPSGMSAVGPGIQPRDDHRDRPR